MGRALPKAVVVVVLGMASAAIWTAPASAQEACLPGAPLPGCDPPTGPAPPPGEEPPPSPPPSNSGGDCDIVRPSGRGSFVGLVSEQVFAGDAAYRRCALSDQARAGVRILRQTLRWSEVEPLPGQYSFGYFDAYVRALAEHGIQLLPILFDPPLWASSRPLVGAKRGTYPPSDPAVMGEFAAVAAARYGPNGSFWAENPDLPKVPVRNWQIWNEPNFPTYWPEGPNAKEYVDLLRGVGGAIKRVDRRAKIVTAGLPDSRAQGAIRLTQFVKEMYKARARGSFDLLAVNAYARSAKELITRVRSVRKVMKGKRDRSKVWITEVGWATQGPKSRYTVTPKKQAKLIQQSFDQVARQRRRLKIAGLVYYSWQDAPTYAGFGDFWGLHTGLLDKNGEPKPGHRAFSSRGKRLRKTR